jgi:hypothetical protein
MSPRPDQPGRNRACMGEADQRQAVGGSEGPQRVSGRAGQAVQGGPDRRWPTGGGRRTRTGRGRGGWGDDGGGPGPRPGWRWRDGPSAIDGYSGSNGGVSWGRPIHQGMTTEPTEGTEPFSRKRRLTRAETRFIPEKGSARFRRFREHHLICSPSTSFSGSGSGRNFKPL